MESLGIIFKYDSNPNSEFSASYINKDKEIIWTSMSNFILFEELFHAYQYKVGYVKIENGKIANLKNMEVEAKLALYQYAIKTGATSGLPVDPQIWRDAFDPYIASPTPANYQKMLDFLGNGRIFGQGYINMTESSASRTTNNASTLLNCQN